MCRFGEFRKTYFAFCPPAECEELIELMISREDEQSALAADRRFVERLVEHTVSKGYGENNSHWGQERKIAAIAIPITHENGLPEPGVQRQGDVGGGSGSALPASDAQCGAKDPG